MDRPDSALIWTHEGRSQTGIRVWLRRTIEGKLPSYKLIGVHGRTTSGWPIFRFRWPPKAFDEEVISSFSSLSRVALLYPSGQGKADYHLHSMELFQQLLNERSSDNILAVKAIADNAARIAALEAAISEYVIYGTAVEPDMFDCQRRRGCR